MKFVGNQGLILIKMFTELILLELGNLMVQLDKFEAMKNRNNRSSTTSDVANSSTASAEGANISTASTEVVSCSNATIGAEQCSNEMTDQIDAILNNPKVS